MRFSLGALLCAAHAGALASQALQPDGSKLNFNYAGAWFSGDDAQAWLEALDTARSQFSPNPTLQSIDMLYTTLWNGLVEGMRSSNHDCMGD